MSLLEPPRPLRISADGAVRGVEEVAVAERLLTRQEQHHGIGLSEAEVIGQVMTVGVPLSRLNDELSQFSFVHS